MGLKISRATVLWAALLHPARSIHPPAVQLKHFFAAAESNGRGPKRQPTWLPCFYNFSPTN
jgi:hypothetical protein